MNNVITQRGVVDILKELFRIYKGNFLKLWAVVAIIEIPKTAIQFILVRHLNINAYLNNIYLNELLITIYNFVPYILYILYILMYGAITYVVSEQYLGQKNSIWQAYRFAWKKFALMLGASGLAYLILAVLMTAVRFSAGFLIGPGKYHLTHDLTFLKVVVVAIPVVIAAALTLYLAISWIFSNQVALLEGLTLGKALSRSLRLVMGGGFGKICVSLLVILLIIYSVSAPITLILSATLKHKMVTDVIAVVLDILLTYPIIGILLVLLYFDRRVVTGGYNIDKLRAELVMR